MALIVVERSFEEPVAIEDLQAQEDASAWCLETRNVSFVKSYFSVDRKRMLCIYSAPDADAVREAQRQAEMPFDRVYAVSEL